MILSRSTPFQIVYHIVKIYLIIKRKIGAAVKKSGNFAETLCQIRLTIRLPSATINLSRVISVARIRRIPAYQPLYSRSNQKRSGGGNGPWDRYLCGLKKEDRLVPAYTLCLYHGVEKWEGPRKLADMMKFGEDDIFREWFKDYPLHLYCANEAEAKDLSLFRTEVGMLLRVLPYQKNQAGLEKLLEETPEYRCVDRDTLEALAVVLGFPEIWLEREKYLREDMEGKEEYDMCQAVEEWAQKERREGRKEGKRDGLREGQETKLIQQTQRKLRKGKTAEEIAEDLEEPLERVRRICWAVESCETEDAAEIYRFMKRSKKTANILL